MMCASASWFRPAKQVVAEEESYCDMLFVKAEKKKEAPLQSVVDTKQPPFQSIKSSSAVVYVDFDDRKCEKKRQKSIYGIVYNDPELQNKKRLLILKSREDIARFREQLLLADSSKQQQQQQQQQPSYTPTFWLDPSAKFFFTVDSGERVKIGDSVLVSKSPEEGVYPALVGDIHYENNDKKVVVERYYSPEETIGGRRSFHGNKELISTDHLESVSARSILRKCLVHLLVNYTRLKHVGPYDYFSRFEYQIGGGWLTPDRVDVFCKCLMPFNPDQFMLKCQDCKERYHPACINMTDDEAKQIDSFTCDECRSLDVNQPSSSADPDILQTLKQQLEEEQARAAEELVKAAEEQERAAEERQQAVEQARAAEERERAAKERKQAAQKRIKELKEQVKQSANMIIPQNDEAKQIHSFRCDECCSLDVNQASADPDMVQPNKRAKW